MTGFTNTYQGVLARFAGTPPTIRVDGPSFAEGAPAEVVNVGDGLGCAEAAELIPRLGTANAIAASTTSDLVGRRITEP